MAPRGKKSPNQPRTNPKVGRRTRSRDNSQSLPFTEEAPTLSEQFSTIAETAADAAHRHPRNQQEQKLLAEDPTKNKAA
eukprot:IDg22302t1